MVYIYSIVVIFIILAFLLLGCAIWVKRAKNQKYSNEIFSFLFFSILPLSGNLLITASTNYNICLLGYYLYMVGTNFMFYSVTIFFATVFSKMTPFSKRLVLAIAILDSASLLANPIFGHVFSITPVSLNGVRIYYALVSHTWHYVHLALSYLLFFNMFRILVTGTIKTPRIYCERYIIIIVCLIITTIWETTYIFQNIPVDIAMIGYSICAILIFYFILLYKPLFFIGHINRKVLESSPSAYVFFDKEYVGFFANESARKMFGLNKQNLAGSFKAISSMMNTDLMGKTSPVTLKSSRIDKQGETHYYKYSFFPLLDEKKRFLGSYIKAIDYTNEEAENQKQIYLSHHDPLTGLYNRNYFIEKTNQILAASEKLYYIVVLDVKDFKLINDTFGYEAGNTLIVDIAEKIRAGKIQYPCYGRLGGDNFVFLATDKNIMEKFADNKDPDNFTVKNNSNYPIIAHYGIFKIEDRSVSIDFMIDRALMAISKIKNNYNQIFSFYEDTLRADKIWEQKVTGMLSNAIKEKQIVPYLQPQINSKGEVVGAEVLVRWNLPSEGILSPAKFIPVLERNGLITKIDLYIWEEAFKIMHKWQNENKKDISISVNISPKDFFFTDIYGTFTGLSQKYDVPPSKIHLEITETVVMTNLEFNLNILHSLQNEGFLIEIDDFGSGYSSLNTLKDIPLNVLKIDMLFLCKTANPEKANIILNTIIELAHKLNIPTVTEGIETKEQLDMLIKMGGNIFQGYYFSKPICLEEFEQKFLNNNRLF
ncbi:MAG: EAL domain-containing protein [Treponema sp.]|nr:EAL domain-containing protein [Treponema sp.]